MDPSLRKRMKELEIRALHLVNNRFMGEWASNMRGQGLEFRDLREYVIGDDVRRLDWKATARSGRPQLRRFTEDRQQSIYLALDISASMDGQKAEMARQLVALLGWAAVKQGDRFGLLGFSDHVEIHRPPARGEAQLWATLEDIVAHSPQSKQTNLTSVWEFFLKRLSGHRATIIIVSDFAAGLDISILKALAVAHDVLAFRIADASETNMMSGGLAPFVDSETGEESWVDLSSEASRRFLRDTLAADSRDLRLSLRKAGVWYQSFSVDKDFLPSLMEFFHRRMEVLGA